MSHSACWPMVDVQHNCSLLIAASYCTPLCPQDKVGSRTIEGRKLRRGVLKGSVIAFVTAGTQQLK